MPAEHALQGGESDCRNRTLHQLFLQLGLGERAGSGLPKIRHAWESQGYSVTLTDSFEPYDQSVLEVTKVLENKPSLGFAKRSEKSSGKSSGKSSDKTDVLILERLAGAPGMTISELAEQLELSTRAIEKQLRKLQESDRLRRVGPAKGGHWEVMT